MVNKFLKRKKGFTLVEILIVVSLIGIINFALYRSLINGVGVWQRAEATVIEEDIAIFFDSIAQDLRNTVLFSKIRFEGTEFSISIPTIIDTYPDLNSGLEKDQLVRQIGQAQYYYDFIEDGLFYKQSTYGQLQNFQTGKSRVIIESVQRVKFRYFYQTEHDEISSDSAYDAIPTGIEIEVQFSDQKGERSIKRFIDIPVSG